MFRSQHEPEYYDHSSDSEDFEKSKNVLEKEVDDSYLEFRIFAEENLRNDEWELQAKSHRRSLLYTKKIYRKFKIIKQVRFFLDLY